MILIIAEPSDAHARVVERRLEARGEACVTLNAADFPQRCGITSGFDEAGCEDSIVGPHGRLRVGDVKGLWIRRMSAHDISPQIADPTVARFSFRQCRDHFMSLAEAIPNVISPRPAELDAECKPRQLRVAQSVGLRIPKTLISNRAADIREFLRAAKTKIIYKTLSSPTFQFMGTAELDDEAEALLDTAELAPTIFQEKIEAQLHIRSTIVDDLVLSVSIKSEKDHAQLDWRLDRDPEIRPHRLPDEIERRLIMLRRALGLRYGAADLILSTSGEYVFLEINPGGQFLFAEIHGGAPISEAIADALIGESAGANQRPAFI
jgi:hypothetical protein